MNCSQPKMNQSTARSAKFIDDCSLTVLLEPNQMSPKEVELLEAARKNDVETVQKLLDDRIDVNIRNNLDRTALHWAAANGNRDVIEVLVRSSADVNVPDKYGTTPLLLAAWYGHVTALEQLVKSKRTAIHWCNKQGMNAIHCAAINDHINILDFFYTNKLLDKIGIDKPDVRGKTAIQLAAEKGHTGTVDYLLNIGCNPSIADSNGRTALHGASADGHDQIVVSILMKSDEVINLADKEGLTALHLAAASGHPDIVQQLLTAGADINAQTNKGVTALMLSVTNGHLETASTLLKNSLCERNHQNNDGNTAVHLSSANSNANILRLLITNGCDVNITNKIGQSALHVAAERGQTSTVFLLLTSRSNLARKDNAGKTALQLASRANCVAIVDMIIKQERVERILGDSETAISEYDQRDSVEGRNANCQVEGSDVTDDVPNDCNTSQTNADCAEIAADAVARRDSVSEPGRSNEAFDQTPGPSTTRQDDVSVPDSDEFIATSSTDGGAEVDLASDAKIDDEPDAGPSPAQIEDPSNEFPEPDEDKRRGSDDVCRETEEASPPPAEISRDSVVTGDDDDDDRLSQPEINQSALSQIVIRSISNDYLSAMKTVLWKLAMKKLNEGDWKKLAKYWEFTDEQIKAIEHQYTGLRSHRDHAYRMMLIWLESYVEVCAESSCSPIRGLYDGLVAIDRRNLAERMRNKCNRQTEPRKQQCTIS